jgi:uncharacterized membrane protein YebE (DUF533 family)
MFDPKKLLNEMLGAEAGAKAGAALDDAGGLVGALFRQATDGLKEGASAIDEKTGISGKVEDALKERTGKSAGEHFGDARQWVEDNKLSAGLAAGGVAALLLGTRGGRALAGNAAKLGGLALVGGLAYKAWKNHEAGKPMFDTGPKPDATPDEPPLIEAPKESLFGEIGDVTQDNAAAMLILRAMIAAAASDGLIDNAERSRIIGALERAGLDVGAAKFLDVEFAKPATPTELGTAATSDVLKMQAYTAARLAIDPDKPAEKAFLAELAVMFGLDAGQVSNVEKVVAAHGHA